jgi:hypothetical protein
MVPGWFPFKIVSDSPAFHSRWPLLLKIEISSNGQHCPILCQNVPKFELYKHNDELFNEVGITGHNFERGPSKDYSTKVWLQLVQWFLRRRLKCEMLTDGRQTKSDDNSSHGLKARWAKKKSILRTQYLYLKCSKTWLFIFMPGIWKWLMYTFWGGWGVWKIYLISKYFESNKNSGQEHYVTLT